MRQGVGVGTTAALGCIDHDAAQARELAVPEAFDGVARFGFADLCEAPLGAADFLRIAEAFHSVIVDGIPVIAPERRDVARALETLRMAGLARAPGRDLQIEYPIAGAWDGGLLLSGYIDLVAVTDGSVDVIDFKTDAPPHGPVEHAYPQYVGQVRAYGRLLGASGILQDRSIRCGLLFTADGEIRWVTP